MQTSNILYLKRVPADQVTPSLNFIKYVFFFYTSSMYLVALRHFVLAVFAGVFMYCQHINVFIDQMDLNLFWNLKHLFAAQSASETFKCYKN